MKGGNFNPRPIDRVNKSISYIRAEIRVDCIYLDISSYIWLLSNISCNLLKASGGRAFGDALDGT